MLTRVELLNNTNSSTELYTTQTGEGRGSNNLFVGGSAQDKVFLDCDQSVVLTGSGNDTVNITGNRNQAESNKGDNTIIAVGNGNSINTSNGNNNINVKGNYNSVTTDNAGAQGNNILLIGNHSNINGGDGTDHILALGNNNNIGGGDGDNSIVFEGDNLNITAGNGNNTVASLDFAIANGLYADFASYLDGKEKTTTSKNELISSEDVTEVLSKDVQTTYSNTAGSLINKLSAADKAILETIDLTEKVGNKPRYVIAKARDGKVHIYDYLKQVSKGRDQYHRLGKQLPQGSNYLYLSDGTKNISGTTTSTTTTTTVMQDKTVNKYADVTKTILEGNKNINVTLGNGNNTAQINAHNLDFTTGNGNNNITAVDGIVVDTQYSNQRTEEILNGDQYTDVKTTTQDTDLDYATAKGNYSTGSPLIIDFNQDGKVSATHGVGVDVDGNGTADGAATGGDKMLAMTDINGNGKIDGQEVFGDKTVNPFTGESINAANGFEALKTVAQSAQVATGINCIDDKGMVDLKKLNEALETKGIKLGFISDNNTSEVEDLTKVAYINTNDYVTQQQEGKIQHNQLGTSIFEDGSTAKTNDVWFELTGLDNPFDLTKLKDAIK